MFTISEKILDLVELQSAVRDTRSGGYVSFEGWVRRQNEGREVLSLEYEAFTELALLEGDKILAEARARYKIVSARCAHRVGHLQLGEVAVFVGVSAAHRGEAYRASRYIIDEIKLRLPIWKKEHYKTGQAEWVNCQECYKHAHHHHAPSEEKVFYSRQTALAAIGEAGQRRLKAARVVVVGAGGLGCPVLTQLAVSGVGQIRIIDPDRVEMSNLARQTLYRFADVGLSKAVLAGETLRALNPFLKIESVEQKLDFENAPSLLSECDLVLDCSDNFPTKFLLHDFCHQRRVPLVMASLYQTEGEIQFFANALEGAGGCLRCLWPEMPNPNCVRNCNEAGVLPSVPSAVGTLQAKLAIDHLLGRPVDSRKILIDLETLEMDKVAIPRAEGCWLCGQAKTELKSDFYKTLAETWEVEAFTLQPEPQWIDIRNPEERQHHPLPKGSALSDVTDYSALDASKRYLIVCQKGLRSAALTKDLRKAGLEHFFSLKKGVEGLDLGRASQDL